MRGEKPALSEIFLQQLIGIIHGTIRIDVSGGGGRYAGHSSLREISTEHFAECSSHLSRGLRYRSPSENQTTLSDQETSMHPLGLELLGYVNSSHVAGLPPSRRCSIKFYNSHYRRVTNNMALTGSGSLWRSGALSGSWFTPCVARCQTNLEHEQVQAIQDPFSGTLSFFSLIRQIALLGASATLTYRFQLDESYIWCHVFMVISKLCQSHHDER